MPSSINKLTYKTVWKTDNPQVRFDAQHLWETSLGDGLQIPPGQLQDRLKSLCVVVYNGSEMAAVSTVGIGYFNNVQAKVAWFRCCVGEKYREQGIATELAAKCKVVMEEWSKNHPADRVLGFGTIVESPHLTSISKRPIWPKTGMILVGHTQNGQQIRFVWFKHAFLGRFTDQLGVLAAADSTESTEPGE